MVLAYSYASATLRFPFMLDDGVDDDDLLETEYIRNSCPHNIENFEKSKNLYFQYSEFCLFVCCCYLSLSLWFLVCCLLGV